MITSQATCRPLRLSVVPPSPPRPALGLVYHGYSTSRLPAAWQLVAVGGTPLALTLVGGALYVLDGDAPPGARASTCEISRPNS